MANSFDRQNDAAGWVSDYQQADRLVSNIVAQYQAAAQIMVARRAAIVANANGAYVNPDDTNKVDAQIAALKARITTAMGG